MSDVRSDLRRQLDQAEQEQRWTEVEALCRRLLQQNPDHWPVWQRLACAHEAREDWVQAETLWRHLTQRFANRSEPYLALAALQRKRGAPDAARQVLDQASRQIGPTPGLQAALGVIDDPWASAPAAAPLSPETPAEAVAARLQRAQEHLDAGRAAEAEACLEQVLQARPHAVSLNHQLARLRLRRGASAAVVDQLQPWLLACEPQQVNLELALLLAQALERERRWDELVALLEPLLPFQPDQPRLLLVLARAALALDRDRDALPLLQRSLRLDPAQPRVELALGELFHRRGDVEAAAAAFERALTLDPLLEPAADQLQRLRAEQAWQLGEAALAGADWHAAAAAYRPLLDHPAYEARARARLELLASLEPEAQPCGPETAATDALADRLARFHASLDELELRIQAVGRFDSRSAS